MKVTANGVEIHYELSGPDAAPVVTLSNSLMSNVSMWERQLKALKGFRVLRYDTRGHGDSEAAPGDYTVTMLAKDLRGLWGALGIEKSHFVGLSLGGMIGQELAIESPERLLSLVLCDTRGHSIGGREQQRRERIATVREQGVEPIVEGALTGWFSEGFREANPELMEKVRAMIRTTAPEGLIGCSHAINEQNHTPRLSEIALPTLIIVGENDEGTPVSASEDMHARIEGSTLVVLPEAKHLSNLERPDEFNAALAEFLPSAP